MSKACFAPLFHAIKEINISLRGAERIAWLFIDAGESRIGDLNSVKAECSAR